MPSALDINLEELLSTIRVAASGAASPAERANGAEAAKTIQTLLRATPGMPLGGTAQPASPLGQMVQQLKNTPQTVILDALIAKLTSYLPKDAVAPTSSVGMRVPFVPIPGALKDAGEGERS